MKIQFSKNILLVAGVAVVAAVSSSTAYAETPYQGTFVKQVQPSGGNPGNEMFLFFPSVPAGKHLVIDHVSFKMWVPSGNHVTCDMTASQPQVTGLFPAQYFLDAPKLSYTDAVQRQDLLLISQDVHLSVDQGPPGTLTVHCSKDNSGIYYGGGGGGGGVGSWLLGATIIGHLDDVVGQ